MAAVALAVSGCQTRRDAPPGVIGARFTLLPDTIGGIMVGRDCDPGGAAGEFTLVCLLEYSQADCITVASGLAGFEEAACAWRMGPRGQAMRWHHGRIYRQGSESWSLDHTVPGD
jgi:hypothetical protein